MVLTGNGDGTPRLTATSDKTDLRTSRLTPHTHDELVGIDYFGIGNGAGPASRAINTAVPTSAAPAAIATASADAISTVASMSFQRSIVGPRAPACCKVHRANCRKCARQSGQFDRLKQPLTETAPITIPSRRTAACLSSTSWPKKPRWTDAQPRAGGNPSRPLASICRRAALSEDAAYCQSRQGKH